MKRVNKIFLFMILFVFGINSVSAICSSEEMNKIRNEAFQVKPSYEKTTRVLDSNEVGIPDGSSVEETIEVTVDYFKIHINNLTENLYVTVHDDVTNETKKYTYSDSNSGTIIFEWSNITKIVNYTIKVFSSDKTGCPDTQLYVTNLKIPRYNYYSNEMICNEAKDFYLCQNYVTIDKVDYMTFQNKVQAYLDGKIDNEGQEKKEELKKETTQNKSSLIIGIGVVVGISGGIAILIVVKKKRSKKNEIN